MDSPNDALSPDERRQLDWFELRERIRAELPVSGAIHLLGTSEARALVDGVWTIAVGSVFGLGLLKRHLEQIDAVAQNNGYVAVEFVVDESLKPPPQNPMEVELRAEQEERERAALERASAHLEPAPLLLAQMFGERGFWSLGDVETSRPYEIEDRRGRLRIIPSALGVPSPFEATVLSALLGLWGNDDRSQRFVRTSIKALASYMQIEWGGRTAAQLRKAIERLKATSYQLEMADEGAGWEDLFSLLDRVQSRWDGPRTSPERTITAVWSETVFEIISDKRQVRVIDLDTIRALGHQRQLARRLFLFMESIPDYRLKPGEDRALLDFRWTVGPSLAGSLGTTCALKELPRLLIRAGHAVCDASDRYARIDVTSRMKKGLRVGDPRYELHVQRRRRIRQP